MECGSFSHPSLEGPVTSNPSLDDIITCPDRGSELGSRSWPFPMPDLTIKEPEIKLKLVLQAKQ